MLLQAKSDPESRSNLKTCPHTSGSTKGQSLVTLTTTSASIEHAAR
jgi:hypothetical protein